MNLYKYFYQTHPLNNERQRAGTSATFMISIEPVVCGDTPSRLL